MIFVAVGTQFPFDRLVQAVDGWAAARGRSDVFGQIGPSEFRPRAIQADRYLAPDLFAERCRTASVLVAHAGMGLIISALELGKPIIIMPRRASLGEHRNEHQLATAAKFQGRAGIYVAREAEDVAALLDRAPSLCAGTAIAGSASPQLLQGLRTFIEAGARPRG